MSDRITTKAGVFESGDQDAMGVQYKDGRLIACRNPKLTDYAVAEGTEVICDRAFMNMKELRSVILPASLRAIGESAFSGCKALADISLPDGVTEIRQATFRDCDALAAIELPASVTEIEKFAFGRGLTTLVVNAPEMKIDRYAFMNARDFSTLMVPAGTADYYRALLADMRVKADVEETQESVDTEENKTKVVTVEVSGYEKWLQPKDEDNDDEECYDAVSRFAANNLTLTVDGVEYTSDDVADADDIFSREQLKDYEAFDAAKFFAESGAEQGLLYINKASTTIDIEIPEEESFDPNKVALVLRDFIYPDDTDEPTVCAFIYDGIFYDCNPEDSRGISREQIWPCDPDAETDDFHEMVEEKRCGGLIVEMDEDQYIGLESDDYDDDYSNKEEQRDEKEEEKYGLIDKKGNKTNPNTNKRMEKGTKDDGLRTIKFTLSSYGERIDLFDEQDNLIKSIFRGMLYDDDPYYFLDQYEMDPAGDDAMDAALGSYSPLYDAWTSRDENADEHDPNDEIFYKSSRDLEVDYEDEKWDHYEKTPIKISGSAEIRLPMDAEFDEDKCHLIANSIILPNGRRSSLYIMGFCYDGEYYPLVIDVDSEQETGDDDEADDEDW